jgi:uncharacterized membrane protein
MMSQNRMSEKDRIQARQDYEVNIKAELEILQLQKKINELREGDWTTLIGMQQQQIELLEALNETQQRQIGLLERLLSEADARSNQV